MAADPGIVSAEDVGAVHSVTPNLSLLEEA